MQVQAYLSFDGRAEEAAAFYQRTLGAKIEMLMRMKDSPAPAPEGMVPPGSENKVMHMALRIGDTLVLASDGACHGKPVFQGVSLALTMDSEAEAERAFAALADGGQVQMPIGPTFFAKRFGMLTDPFGVAWMVLTAH